MPIAVARFARFAVSLNPYKRDNKYFRYLEAWHLLTREPPRRLPNAHGKH